MFYVHMNATHTCNTVLKKWCHLHILRTSNFLAVYRLLMCGLFSGSFSVTNQASALILKRGIVIWPHRTIHSPEDPVTI